MYHRFVAASDIFFERLALLAFIFLRLVKAISKPNSGEILLSTTVFTMVLGQLLRVIYTFEFVTLPQDLVSSL